MIDITAWHPKLQRLYRYWESIHPADGLPGRRHFDPVAVADLLQNIWLMDVQREPFRLKYRLVGTLVVSWIGKDHTGRWLDEVHPHILAAPAAKDTEPGDYARFRRVVDSGVPDWRRGKPTLSLVHKDFVEIERLVLPLASDGRTVDILLVGTIFHDGEE